MSVSEPSVEEAGTPATPSPRGRGATHLDLRFGKEHRLLTPKEFKQVFDGAVFKASHRCLLLLAIPTTGSVARMGLVIAKKHAKLAVQRNRMKRQLRESFRYHQSQLVGLDIVALAKPGLWQQDNATMRATIDEQWQRLLKQKRKAVLTSVVSEP